MRLAVLTVLVAAQLLPVTYLVVDLPDPPEVLAGQQVSMDGIVQLQGPTGDMPGLGTEVDLSLEAAEASGCRLEATSTRLDTTSGSLPFGLICRPEAPGNHTLRVLAEAEPHGSGTWDGTLVVQPDRLTARLSAGPVDGFGVALTLTAEPEHLASAPVELVLTSELAGTVLGFQETHAMDADGDPVEIPWTARHGPGTYTVDALLDGPLTETWNTSLTIEVPEPPTNATLDLNVTIEGPGPQVNLTGDSVNDDGKTKSPGQELITRLAAEHTDTVDISVLRPVGNDTVLLANQTLTVEPDGSVEHRFSHPVLPAGPLIVQAQAGDSSVARTAQIRDTSTDAEVTGPAKLLGDGRPLELTGRIVDDNLGSTALDPGPVWGLPDITWRVLKGSQTADGWTVSLGAFSGGPEGTAELSRLSWPDGGPWASVTDGAAELVVALVPPADVEPGEYRVSLYGPDGDRIGGQTFDVLPPPSIGLTGDPPVPLEGWPVNLTVEDPADGLAVNLTVTADGQPVDNRTFDGPATPSFELPDPLPAGTPVAVEAWATWPGRPPTDQPDARLEATVPALEPRIEAWTSLDGRPMPGPLAVHPAGAHTVEIHPQAVEPNGEPVELTARILAPDGQTAPWEIIVEGTVTVEVPADPPPGRYTVELVARTPTDEPVVHPVAIDVAPVTRLAVDGPEALQLATDTPGVLAVNVTNTGTSTFHGIVADLRGPSGLTGTIGLRGKQAVALGETVPVSLEPGGSRQLELSLDASQVEQGSHEARLTVAGVIP